jgi:prepilin-type N-terminal cleavage/methylation domain-containing protein
MKISSSTIENNKLNQRGFSLLEILVVIALLSLVVMIGVSMSAPERDVSLEATNLIERAVRFSSNEAALRNTVIRIHFYFDEDPQKFTVEYGPDDSYIIPVSDLDQGNKDDLSESEQKVLEERIKEANRQFNKIPEFKNEDMGLPEGVKIIGIGSTLHEKLLYDFEGSIYIYPTGEKDESIIFFATFYELISITIPAFSQDFRVERYPFEFELDSEEDIYDQGIAKATTLFDDWRKLQ